MPGGAGILQNATSQVVGKGFEKGKGWGSYRAEVKYSQAGFLLSVR